MKKMETAPNSTKSVTTSYTTAPSRGIAIDRTFAIINQMVLDGIIESYAIGGATAAFFYVEPDTTYDLDVFCVLTGVKKNALDMLTPVYRYLKTKGYAPEAEGVNIEG
ncbi:MAG: hypothetical protein ACREBC_27180, partial [Pyrinomonadaceae bacterium]